MIIRKGMLITIKDANGAQIFGLDSQFAESLVKEHGANGVYRCSLGAGTVEVIAYTDHRSRFAIWKHTILERLYQRQLRKALRRTASTTPTATTDKTNTLSIPSSQLQTGLNSSLISTKNAAGPLAVDTKPSVLCEARAGYRGPCIWAKGHIYSHMDASGAHWPNEK